MLAVKYAECGLFLPLHFGLCVVRNLGDLSQKLVQDFENNLEICSRSGLDKGLQQ